MGRRILTAREVYPSRLFSVGSRGSLGIRCTGVFGYSRRIGSIRDTRIIRIIMAIRVLIGKTEYNACAHIHTHTHTHTPRLTHTIDVAGIIEYARLRGKPTNSNNSITHMNPNYSDNSDNMNNPNNSNIPTT